jgi:hypothetical protein
MALQKAFGGEYVVQDDARQHVFWMQRFLDPGLFPNDLIADYFQTVAPAGYVALYRLAATLGIDPFIFNKFLPSAIVLVTSGYCFGVCWQMFPVPAAGFVATLLLNQNLWISNDVASATPRAFMYPLFLAFTYYLLRRSLVPCAIAIALLGLFYPQGVFLGAGLLILQLVTWEGRRPKLTRNLKDWRFCGVGLAAALLVMLPYALTVSEFEPTLSVTQAREMPEFFDKGRSAFFSDSFEEYWLNGERSGMFPRALFTPVPLIAGLFLPLLLPFPKHFPQLQKLQPTLRFIPQLLLVSAGMFFAAHTFLFELHLPSRYTAYSFQIALALAAGITLTLLLDGLLRWGFSPVKSHRFLRQGIALCITTLLGATLLLYPNFVDEFPLAKYKTGEAPTLYEFLQAQPPDTLVASLSAEANNLPSFTQRSILVGSEYAIPYHLGYYQQFRQRVLDLLEAQYSPNLATVQSFIRTYGIDFWLLDRTAFDPAYVIHNPWLQQYQPAAAIASQTLMEKDTPALIEQMPRCSVLETPTLVLLDATCIAP